MAGIDKYLVAKHDKTLYCELLSFHHSNGSWLSFFEAIPSQGSFPLPLPVVTGENFNAVSLINSLPITFSTLL